MNIIIYYEDTDVTGIVYHANYIKFCDRARSEYFFKNKIDLESFEGYLTIHSLNCRYIAPAKLGDNLNIISKIIALKKTSIEIEHLIYINSELIFKMDIKLIYVLNKKPYLFPIKMCNLFKLILKDKK